MDFNQRRSMEQAMQFISQVAPAMQGLNRDMSMMKFNFDMLFGFLARLIAPDRSGTELIAAFNGYIAEVYAAMGIASTLHSLWIEGEKALAWRERLLNGTLEPEDAAAIDSAIDKAVVTIH